jgi:hypothetical protein
MTEICLIAMHDLGVNKLVHETLHGIEIARLVDNLWIERLHHVPVDPGFDNLGSGARRRFDWSETGNHRDAHSENINGRLRIE